MQNAVLNTGQAVAVARGTERGALEALWAEMRPRQWVKNVFVLAPVLFSQNLFNPRALAEAGGAFALFCLVSSSVYLLNDIRDCAEDRLHPRKRLRPLAAGEIGPGTAWAAMAGLLLLGTGGGFLLGWPFLLVLLGYWLVNLLYSLWLKNQVILDVFAIASGFVLRVAGGGIAIGAEVSHWLLICTTLLALYLGFSKRRHELLLLGDGAAAHRQVLVDYSPLFLDMMIGIVTASTVMSYALYTVSEETLRKFGTRSLLFTLPFVLYGVFRYLFLIYRKEEKEELEDPTECLLADRPMQVNLVLWALTAAVILYS